MLLPTILAQQNEQRIAAGSQQQHFDSLFGLKLDNSCALPSQSKLAPTFAFLTMLGCTALHPSTLPYFTVTLTLFTLLVDGVDMLV